MKAIHNFIIRIIKFINVVLYPKDTEKWKQFTTAKANWAKRILLFCIPKILKNESNSQLDVYAGLVQTGCFVSQRYWKMKAIHNARTICLIIIIVVLYPKDTEKWKQFTTNLNVIKDNKLLFCIPKILKNESNSQLIPPVSKVKLCCFVSQRYWKMKAIHNVFEYVQNCLEVVLYPKDTEKWKQFTTDNHLQ